MKTHTFNGRRYKVFIDPDLDGWCEQFKCNIHEIHLLRDTKTRAGLITAIHEALHAENWSKEEKDIDRVSREIGTFLWRLGYRKSTM